MFSDHPGEKRAHDDDGTNTTGHIVKKVYMANNATDDDNDAEENLLSAEQRRAMEVFRAGENVFVTGAGGTGKSHLLRLAVDDARRRGKTFQVCSTTGRSAVMLGCRARTIHSWAGIGLCRGPQHKIVQQALRKLRANAKTAKHNTTTTTTTNWLNVDILILDEVSMLSCKVLDVLDELARTARGRPLEAFGGIQVMFLGDFFQLPPADDDHDDEEQNKKDDIRLYAFESAAWGALFPDASLQQIKLTRVYRQQGDDLFIKILGQVREGRLSQRSHAILLTRCKQDKDTAESADDAAAAESAATTKLFPLRAMVDWENTLMYGKLSADAEEVQYDVEWRDTLTQYIDDKSYIEASVINASKLWTAAERRREQESLLRSSPCAETLFLKRGARVMLCANLDVENGLCNGAMGEVIGFQNNHITTLVAPTASAAASATTTGATITTVNVVHKWPIIRFFGSKVVRVIMPQLYQSALMPTLGFHQVPLKLAWAMTIHGAQGATLDRAEVDVGSRVFTVGQTYVALSRVRSLAGLTLVGYDPTKIKVSRKVKEFYSTF